MLQHAGSDQLFVNRRIVSQAKVQRFTHSLSINDLINIIQCRDTQPAYTMFEGTGKSRD